MENLMFKDMAKRYEEFFNFSTLEERATKTICFWTMSSIEAFFWGLGYTASFEVDLYAIPNRIFLLFHHPSGEDYELFYFPTYAYDKIEVSSLLENVATSLNNITYPLTTEISSPLLSAYYTGKCEQRGKYRDFEHIQIYVDMLPDADDDPANKGKH